MNQTNDSYRIFAYWLVALFLAALGAQLRTAWLYGSPLLLWDQWYEASFFKLWLTGNLKWADFIAGHNEHRIFATRVLDLSLIWANGRWEPLLQMTVNAFIHAAFACGLAFGLWHFSGRKNGWLVCCLLAPFFVLPYAGENAIWGINSLNYFVNIFGVTAMVGLGFTKAGSWRWWVGIIAAVLGLFTTASGLLAPLATGGLLVLRTIKNRRIEKGDLISFVVCLCVVVLGASLNVTEEVDRTFQAHSFLEFTAALTRNLSWPFYHASVMPCFIGLPLAILLALYFRPNFQSPRAAEFLLVIALWSILQSAAIAYGRANYGGDIPSSRYMDLFNIFVIACVFAAVLLAQTWERDRLRNGILAFVYIAVVLFGLCWISHIVVDGLLAPTRMRNLVDEERVQRFMATGNESDFLENPTVRPDPQLALSILKDKDLQTILPACCQPASQDPKTGWPTAISQCLLQHSTAILSAGLILFAGLCAFGLARGTAGLAPRNPAGILALLAALAALGFVWSKHAVSRESVEYNLQEQVIANFKRAGNLKRAAIHEQKAEELKQFAN